MLADGTDPREHKREAKRKAQAKGAAAKPFKTMLVEELTRRNLAGGIKGDRARHLISSAQRHAKSLYTMDCGDIMTEHVMAVIEPIWTTQSSTAVELLRLIAKVLSFWASSHHVIPYHNPARWEDHMQNILGKHEHTTTNRAALPYAEVPALMTALREVDAIHARAMEFLIMTGTREKETREAVWGEIDLEGAMWTIPAVRLGKTKQPFRVPLSRQAVALLRALPSYQGGEYEADDAVFPSDSMYHQALFFARDQFSRLLVALDYTPDRVTPHGMRSSFGSWLAETHQEVPVEVQDMCLDHAKRPKKVRGSYVRIDYYETRVGLMQSWSDFIGGTKVTSLGEARRKRRAA
jgi:hypothetical protein